MSKKTPSVDDALKAITDGEPPPLPKSVTTFANYVEIIDKGKPVKVPRHIDELTADIWNRLGDFPRRIGSTLFYFDPKAKKPIRTLDKKQSLFAWIQGEGRCLTLWQNGTGFVTQDQFYERVFDKATYYEGTAAAPYYPHRDDIFPTYGELPKADPEHHAFWELINRFNPSDEANRTILAAFVLTPIWFDGINDKPMCLVDTDDAQGSGKTTVVKMIARLYDRNAEAEYLDIDIKCLAADDTKIKKEILSAEGRSKRIILFDNLTKTLKGDSLAKLVTGGKVSGMAPYGRGTETRPADFTFFGTMNGARTDEDMTTRSYVMRVKSVDNPDPNWENETVGIIRKNRLQILADGLDLIEHAIPRHRQNKSRFGVYDATILSAVCRTDEEFAAADNALAEASGQANADADIADTFTQRLTNALHAIHDYDDNIPVVIAQEAVTWLLSQASETIGRVSAIDIRNLVKAGRLDDFSKDFKRFSDCEKYQHRRGRAFFVGMRLISPEFRPSVLFQYVEKVGVELKIAFRATMPTPKR